MIILFCTNEKLTLFIYTFIIHTLYMKYFIQNILVKQECTGTLMLDLTQAIIYQCIYTCI